MNANMYLHEIVRTVPGREEPYLGSVLSLHHEPSRRHRGRPAFAQFRSIAVSGAWPVGVNIWENTWEGQTEDLTSQFQDGARDTAMEDWWNRNLHLRRGGYDRMLIPASYSPTLAQLEERGVRGEVFLHEIHWLPFDEPKSFLERFEREVVPELAERGLALVGAFRVAMRPRQVLTILCAREWGGLGAWLDPGRWSSGLQGWHRYLDTTVEQSEELVLLPARHGPLVPPRP